MMQIHTKVELDANDMDLLYLYLMFYIHLNKFTLVSSY